MKQTSKVSKAIPLEERITHLLNELRIVLPGTQAILGFQFASVFSEVFQRMPQNLKYLHLVSLCCVLLSIIFLLGAPAFNRIVEPNKATEKFHAFASKIVLIALFFLAVGMSIEMYVVGMVITNSEDISFMIALVAFLLSTTLWFGYSWYTRQRG